MYWSFVVVHILIIALITYDAFPIDLMEIEHDDIYLVDKERKGRFVQVNQTTFLPNTNRIELIREKKSSNKIEEKPSDGVDVFSNNVVIEEEKKSTTGESLFRNPFHDDVMASENNYTYSGSLFEPQTFGYASLLEDNFMDAGHQPTGDDCCNFNEFMDIFYKDYSCTNAFIVPEESSFC